eukprot:UN16716
MLTYNSFIGGMLPHLFFDHFLVLLVLGCFTADSALHTRSDVFICSLLLGLDD